MRVGMPGVCGAMDQVFWEALKDGPLDTTPLHFPQALAFHPSVPGVAFIAEAAGQNIHTGQAVEDVSILRVMHSLCTNTTAGACDPALLSAEANATAKPFAWSLQ